MAMAVNASGPLDQVNGGVLLVMSSHSLLSEVSWDPKQKLVVFLICSEAQDRNIYANTTNSYLREALLIYWGDILDSKYLEPRRGKHDQVVLVYAMELALEMITPSNLFDLSGGWSATTEKGKLITVHLLLLSLRSMHFISLTSPHGIGPSRICLYGHLYTPGRTLEGNPEGQLRVLNRQLH